MNQRRPAIAFIMVTSLLDVIGIALIIPVLPILLGEFTSGRDTQTYWYMAVAVTFGASQFLCAPLLGALSDRFGRRPLLLLGIAGLGATFVLTALAHSVWLIVAARVLGGGLSANFAVAQAYVADITPPEERTQALGKLGAMFGIGFVLGPVMGGLLGGVNLRLPFWAAASLCTLNWLYGLLVLPESLPVQRRRPLSQARVNPFTALAGLTRLHGVGALVAAFACTSLAVWVMQMNWVLYTNFKFGWGPSQTGPSLFVAGVVALIVQGVLLGRLIQAFGERRLILAGMLSSLFAYTAYGLATHGWMMYAIIACNFLAQGSIVTMQGIVSKAAAPEEQGRVMGTLSALASLATVVAPMISNPLLAQVTFLQPSDWRVGAPFFLAAALQSLALLIAWRHFAAHRVGAASVASVGQPGS
ncbi:MAG TPA: MFS transporter [Burkholderiaceae bacterium]|jgi:DHA1 family tetracycline resistance protein-like MFS transporter|nr:MFS transporter [Burkholderiaceae bacterium]